MSDQPDPIQRLTAASKALQQLASRKHSPTRYDARELLLALGELLLDGREEEAAAACMGLDEALATIAEPWARVVQEELSLACSEHIHSVDPRYLALPNYDFAYSLAARERLEQRLAAAQVLGMGAPSELLGRVAQADALLEAARAAQKQS